jgi:hypothetical protein
MTAKEILEKYPDKFRKIGGIFYCLNIIEIHIVTVLTAEFGHRDSLDKVLIFNEALFDEKIFPTLENKRLFLIKLIKHVQRIAEIKNIKFDSKKYLDICASIGKVQKIRNVLAHNFLSFTNDNKAIYRKRKSSEQLLKEHRQGLKKPSLNTIEIDLDKELALVQDISEQSKRLVDEFVNESNKILY